MMGDHKGRHCIDRCRDPSGRYWVWRLLTLVWLVTTAQPTVADPGRLARIKSAGELRVCIWPDYYGISYRDPKTLNLSGVDVDMAKLLAAELGVRVRFVDSSFSRLIDDMESDRCDIAMFAIAITPARKEKLRFTSPHLASDIYAIASRVSRRIRYWEDIDQPNIVVAVAKGTLHEPIMASRLSKAKLVVLDSPFAREQEVQSGRADVFMTDYPYSQRFLAQNDWAKLVEPKSPYHISNYAWAMLPGDDAWHAHVETFLLRSRTNGRLQDAAQRHGLTRILVR